MSQSRRLDFVLLLGLVVLPAARAEEGVRSVAASATTITIAGSSSHRILRIVELLPDQGADAADTAAVIAEARPAGEQFSVGAPRFDGERDRLYSGFLALRRDGDDWTPVGTHRFVEEFTGLAAYDTPFPEAPSKKGLQVQMVDDALELGVKHAALNVNFSQLVDLRGRDDSLSWRVDGRTVHFHRRAVESLDRQVRPLTDAGVVVSLILLAYQSGDPELDRTLLHPDYSPEAPNRLGAFNTITSDGVLHFRACVGFLAHRYLDPAQYGGRVANYILGNEVNSHWFWANRGRVTMEAFADDYLRTARIAHAALRTASPSARLYLSLEHHWTIRYPEAMSCRRFPAGRSWSTLTPGPASTGTSTGTSRSTRILKTCSSRARGTTGAPRPRSTPRGLPSGTLTFCRNASGGRSSFAVERPGGSFSRNRGSIPRMDRTGS